MHSSRMRIARFSGRLGGGVGCLPRGCLRVCVGGVSAQGVHTPSEPRGRHPHCMLGYTPSSPWTEGMTHACENITLPQTSFAGGNDTLTSVNWGKFQNATEIEMYEAQLIV